MWVYNRDYSKWELNKDTLAVSDFEYLKQELKATRYFSKFLSGATYVPMSDTEDIYDIMSKWKARSWFISSAGSVHSQSPSPFRFANAIDSTTSFDYYTRFLSEYGLTLKNLFTPRRIIRDSVKSTMHVDVATTEFININEQTASLVIDGVRLVRGQKILVKDQTTTEAVDTALDPEEYFAGNYTLVKKVGSFNEYSYYNNENGVYTYDGRSLVRDTFFDDYNNCVRASVSATTGQTNAGKQFHLSRLRNGYFPTTALGEPMEFKEKKNWLLRNRVDYNNLFDINYYDGIRHVAMQYEYLGTTYSIPERTVAVGEFGVINNTQYNMSTIVPNKYKVNLRSIANTTKYYWVCGDDGTLLKIRKHDFDIQRIKTDAIVSLRCVTFFDDVRGVVVGDLNTILITLNGGQSWKRMRITDFAPYNYTRAIFPKRDMIYIVGRSGVFIEIEETASGWSAYKRRISQIIDQDDEIILVDNINDLVYTKTSSWNISYQYSNETIATDKEILVMVTDNGNVIVHDIGGATKFDFIYLDLDRYEDDDIYNITLRKNSTNFYYTSTKGTYFLNLIVFDKLGVGNVYSNTSKAKPSSHQLTSFFSNRLFDFEGNSLLGAGNSSNLLVATYSGPPVTNDAFIGQISFFQVQDSEFESRLRSKLLFMDYDVASKLNFFTDDGNYRTPSWGDFDTNTSGGTTKTFTTTTPQTIIPTTEYRDQIAIAVLPGTKGKVREVRIKVNIQAPNMSKIAIALRKVDGPGKDNIVSIMKFGQAKIAANMSGFTFTTNRYQSKLQNLSTPYTNKTALMDLTPPNFNIVGTGVTINSNKIESMFQTATGVDITYGKWELIVFKYTPEDVVVVNNWSIEFVMENSYFSLTSGAGQVNWIDYVRDSNKTFAYWSNTMPSDSNQILMSASFSSHSGYTTDFPPVLNITSVVTTGNGLDTLFPSKAYNSTSRYFRYNNPAIQNLTVSTTGLNPLNGRRIYLWKHMMVLETDIDWKVSIGDTIRLESSVVEGNFLVNRIIPRTFSVQAGVVKEGRYIYVYTDFNESIIKSLSQATDIKVFNLNTYLDVQGLVDNFNKHEFSKGYGLSFSESSGKLIVEPKFTNDSAYYNLSTTANYSGVTSTMKYQTNFLRFGYSPGYNILDYLTSINKSQTNPTFYPDKEYLAMPVYTDLRMANPWTASTVFINSTGFTQSKFAKDTGNKIVFGPGLRLEWESIFINTFVDVEIYQTSVSTTFSANRLLVMQKYESPNYGGSGMTGLVVEFNKRIKFNTQNTLNDSKISIKSRRKLIEISNDLKELDNISRPRHKISEFTATQSYTGTFSSYERELNGRIPTDSYTRILLSDAETVKEITGVIYSDYKNELALNVTRLDRSYAIPISNTSNYNGMLSIICGEKHELQLGDSVVLDFNGGEFSSQNINQQYFGYHSVKQVINEYTFVADVAYGQPVFVGNDTGTVRYLRKDPFFNYQPVDIIEVGVDKKPKSAIQIDPENIVLSGATFSLSNVDFSRYRYRLIDGMTLERLTENYSWILDAEISDALIGQAFDNTLIWYKGTWESGRWFEGTWMSGTWKYGDWYGGTWNSLNVVDKKISAQVDSKHTLATYSIWQTGRWYDGTWNNGTWNNGRWYGGAWTTGEWYNGIWNDGTWNGGRFIGGIWVLGTWNGGVFNCDNEPSFWIDGTWNGGDFENGIWYNGTFESKVLQARFGTKAYNSRTAIWYGGKWKSGNFYSGINELEKASEVNKYSVWYSGQWQSGEFHGGVAYSMALNTTTWHGGIVEDIQIIGINSKNNSFTLNGIFRFNNGDKLTIIDNNNNNEFSRFGTNETPGTYTVLMTVLDEAERLTEVYVAKDLDTTDLTAYKKNSGLINVQIPNNSEALYLTQSVPYEITKTNEIRVKINLKNHNIGDLLINLRSPNGEVINVKQAGLGGTFADESPNINVAMVPNPNSSMVNTIFSTATASNFSDATSPYTGNYEMSKILGVGAGPYTSSSMEYSSLLDSNGRVKGDWSLWIKDTHLDYNVYHSINNSVQASYATNGDPIEITITGQSQYSKFRKGDLVNIGLKGNQQNIAPGLLSDSANTIANAFVLSSTIDLMFAVGTTTILRLNATASESLSQYFYTELSTEKKKSWADVMAKSNPNPQNRVIDWEIQFVNDSEVGAQIEGVPENARKLNGFDTGLRAVSRFRNANWKSGIWTNGIYETGLFEGGMWLDGIFKGTWG